jgi:hypothetical protein
MATCSQAGGGNAGRQPYEIKQKVYFADGSLDEYTEYGWDKTFSHKDNEVRYSASGGVLDRIEYTYNDAKGNVTTKITMDDEKRPKNRVVYQYTPQGNLWRESLVDNKGKVVSTYEYAYDSKGNRISRIIKNRAGDKLAETTYTFDAQGRMTKSQTMDYSESNISSTEYSYDAQGNLVKQVVMDVNGKTSSIINAIWQDGREMRNEMLAADGTVRMRITNEYGTNGELLKKTVENLQGASKQIMMYEYTFQDARRSG